MNDNLFSTPYCSVSLCVVVLRECLYDCLYNECLLCECLCCKFLCMTVSMQLFLIFNFQDLCQDCDVHFNLVKMLSLFCPGCNIITSIMKWFASGMFLDIFIVLHISLGRLLCMCVCVFVYVCVSVCLSLLLPLPPPLSPSLSSPPFNPPQKLYLGLTKVVPSHVPNSHLSLFDE